MFCTLCTCTKNDKDKCFLFSFFFFFTFLYPYRYLQDFLTFWIISYNIIRMKHLVSNPRTKVLLWLIANKNWRQRRLGNLHPVEMSSLTTAAHYLGTFSVLSENFHLWQVMSSPEKLSDFGISDKRYSTCIWQIRTMLRAGSETVTSRSTSQTLTQRPNIRIFKCGGAKITV